MLHHPIGDHDVADIQVRVQLCHAGEQQRRAPEAISQNRRDDGAVDLAHTRTDHDDVAPVEGACGELGVGDQPRSRVG